jgi:hypothetical protein
METDIQKILKELQALKALLVNLSLMNQLDSIKDKVEEISNTSKTQEKPKDLPKSDLKELKEEAFEDLKHMATNEIRDGERHYILYRATEDFEYERFKVGHYYEPKEDTIWTPEYMTSQETQKKPNPAMGCWIPESSIIDIPEPFGNTSNWKESGGKNPNAFRYKLTVKPGKYEIYQELT